MSEETGRQTKKAESDLEVQRTKWWFPEGREQGMERIKEGEGWTK